MALFRPQETIEASERQRGLKHLLYDGACSQTMVVLAGGPFLVAFALLIGASNWQVGLIASIGPLAQMAQLPAIWLVDRLRWRKLIVVASLIASRLVWFFIAAIPWLVPIDVLRAPVLLGSLLVSSLLASVAGCAFNSWIRDLVPEEGMGAYFARRMAWSIGVGAALSLIAGFAVDLATHRATDDGDRLVYGVVLGVGALVGLLGTTILARIPEPRMTPQTDGRLIRRLIAPFRDSNFRQLLRFLASWNFAVNCGSPFFVVYMLERLDRPMWFVVLLGVVSQFINVVFLRIWGSLADRFSNKSVLYVSGSMFIFQFLLWPFTTLPEAWSGSVPLLALIYVLAGVATAGVGLCSGNIAMKLAPRGEATSYLAVNALTSGLAATAAPIAAGIAAEWFAQRELVMDLTWLSDYRQADITWHVAPLSFRGLDFLFLIAFVLGLYAMHRLLAVTEAGEVQEEVVVQELVAEVRRTAENLSNIPGLRHITAFPYAIVRTANRVRGTVVGGATGPPRAEPDSGPPE